MITRRQLAAQMSAAAFGCSIIGVTRHAFAASSGEKLAADFAAIERKAGGRLGVSVIDMVGSANFGHRADERFPLCSTFKMLLAGAILARVDRGEESLDRRLKVAVSDLLPYSPVTEKRAGGSGMKIGELCEATVTVSDNAAANVLMKSLCGPEALTSFLRAIGDSVTRVDRYEPEMNNFTTGDDRDTTTPAAMVATLGQLATGNVLSASSREQLCRWLIESKTGADRLRTGLPADWIVGDKTGTGKRDTNDVAIGWPPNRPPILIAAYLNDVGGGLDRRNAALSSVAQAVSAALSPA